MSAGAPWSVKGIDPKAREVAKDLARRSGMTLGEWLNRVILEDDVPEEVTAEAQFGDRPFRGGAGEAPRLYAVQPSGAPDLARIAASLDRLTDRIEASETRTSLAISGVEHSVRQALARIETAEREQLAVAARLDSAAAETAERVRRLEADVGPRSAEALRALDERIARAQPELVIETVLTRLGERLAAAEGRTATALDDLKGSLGALDRRLGAVERGEAADGRFEALAQVLTHRVEAVRAEVAEKLQAVATGPVEQRLAEMAEHVRAAERRSAKAVEDMGRQVLAIAEAVNRKLVEVDQRGGEAIDQVGTEIARIAGAVELRLARAEQTQAEAFERLGAELARVSDGLNARLDAADRRAAQAIESVGETVARVAERAPPDAVGPVESMLGPPPEPEPEPLAVPAASFGPELFSRAEPEPETVDAPWRRLDLDVPEADAPEIFAPIAEPEEELFEPAPSGAAPQLSTREVIERARAAARAQSAEAAEQPPPDLRARVDSRAASGRLFQGFSVGRPRRQSTALQTALMVAGGAAFLSVGAAGLTLMQGPAEPKSEQAQSAPLPAQARAALALASPSLAGEPRAAELTPPAPVFETVRAEVEAGRPGAVAALKALADTGHPQAQLYLAQLYDGGEAGLARDLVQARRLTEAAAEAGELRAMHNLAVYAFRGEGGPQDLEAAVHWFRKAANGGVVESQYNLGLLYQSGNGVPKDLVAARHWFRQAAAQGDAEAKAALAELTPKPPAPNAQPARPARAAVAPAPAAASLNLRQTQLTLARLGYYDGPADGRWSEGYRAALARYQHDQETGPRPVAQR